MYLDTSPSTHITSKPKHPSYFKGQQSGQLGLPAGSVDFKLYAALCYDLGAGVWGLGVLQVRIWNSQGRGLLRVEDLGCNVDA